MSLNVPALQALTLHQELDAAKLALQALSNRIARQRDINNRWIDEMQKDVDKAKHTLDAVLAIDDSDDDEEQAEQDSQVDGPTSVWFWDADE